MLDTILYSTVDGSIVKTVTHFENVTDIVAEIEALQAQLASFVQANNDEPSDAMAIAITNYQEQIAFLEAL